MNETRKNNADPVTPVYSEIDSQSSACDQCPGCEALVDSGSKFCPFYGHPLISPSPAPPIDDNASAIKPASAEPVLSCSACGHSNNEEDNFCSHCGCALKEPSTPSQYWLVCQTPQTQPLSMPLPEGEFIVGKGKDCTLTIPDDEYLSRRHLKLIHEDGKILLEDLGSSNGTFLKVRRPIILEPDDEILVGSSVLKMEVRTH